MIENRKKNHVRVSVFVLGLALGALGVSFAQMGPGHGGHHGAPHDAPHLGSELDFITHMIEHHQEAVDSATELQAITQRPELQDLARDIIEVQREEIETLESWLERWYPTADRHIDYQPMMRSLGGLPVEQAERAFIEDMILHHDMAVMDARALLEHDLAEHDEVAAMAREIIDTQTQEIERLRAWLSEWFGAAPRDGMHGRMGMHEDPMGMMGSGSASGMQHDMMRMCMTMMHPTMGHGDAGMHMQHERDQAATAEALARAFLAGRGITADVTGVHPPQRVYRVTYEVDGEERTLLVDMDHHIVRDENAAE